MFHLPCGLKNGSMHQYFQSFKYIIYFIFVNLFRISYSLKKICIFRSFCQQHRITQTVDLSELQNAGPIQCAICKDDVTPSPLPNSIWAPCCKRNAWFHRGCIQDLALSAGYFFKCPLCNNVEIFKGRMLTLGIYIPSRYVPLFIVIILKVLYKIYSNFTSNKIINNKIFRFHISHEMVIFK